MHEQQVERSHRQLPIRRVTGASSMIRTRSSMVQGGCRQVPCGGGALAWSRARQQLRLHRSYADPERKDELVEACERRGIQERKMKAFLGLSHLATAVFE